MNIRCVISVTLASFVSGCSVLMAWKQPGKKDLGVLNSGTDRDSVVAQLGPPVSSEKLADGQTKEIFDFVQGYSSGARETRGFLHASADILTLGLWEVAGTPLESHFDGKRMRVSVVFDANESVVNATTLAVTDPHPNEFAAIRDTILGDNDVPKYSYAPVKGSALIVSSGDPAPDEGDAVVWVVKVDGYFANFTAASPGLLRILRSKSPLYLSPGDHALSLHFIATREADSYTDSQGGTVNGLDVIQTDRVERVQFRPDHVYRVIGSCSDQVFQVDLFDITDGEGNRTHVAGWSTVGTVHFEQTSYTPGPDK